MRTLLLHIRPHRNALLVAGVLGLVGAAAGLAQPLAAREVIEALPPTSRSAAPSSSSPRSSSPPRSSPPSTSGCSSAPPSGWSCAPGGA